MHSNTTKRNLKRQLMTDEEAAEAELREKQWQADYHKNRMDNMTKEEFLEHKEIFLTTMLFVTVSFESWALLDIGNMCSNSVIRNTNSSALSTWIAPSSLKTLLMFVPRVIHTPHRFDIQQRPSLPW